MQHRYVHTLVKLPDVWSLYCCVNTVPPASQGNYLLFAWCVYVCRGRIVLRSGRNLHVYNRVHLPCRATGRVELKLEGPIADLLCVSTWTLPLHECHASRPVYRHCHVAQYCTTVALSFEDTLPLLRTP